MPLLLFFTVLILIVFTCSILHQIVSSIICLRVRIYNQQLFWSRPVNPSRKCIVLLPIYCTGKNAISPFKSDRSTISRPERRSPKCFYGSAEPTFHITKWIEIIVKLCNEISTSIWMPTHDGENCRDKSTWMDGWRTRWTRTSYSVSTDGRRTKGSSVCHVKIMISFCPSFNNL